jgi:hypothetical protein
MTTNELATNLVTGIPDGVLPLTIGNALNTGLNVYANR